MTRTITVAVLTATLLLAGCTSDPGPTPSITDPGAGTGTAEPELTPDPRRAAEQDAIETFKEFATLNNQVAQAGFNDYFPLVELIAGDFAEDLPGRLLSLQESGAHQVGETTLSDFNVVDHHSVDSPLYDDQLSFEVCTDNSSVDILDPSGASVAQPEAKGRWVTTVTMWHRTGTEWWYVAGYLTDGGRPC